MLLGVEASEPVTLQHCSGGNKSTPLVCWSKALEAIVGGISFTAIAESGQEMGTSFG